MSKSNVSMIEYTKTGQVHVSMNIIRFYNNIH